MPTFGAFGGDVMKKSIFLVLVIASASGTVRAESPLLVPQNSTVSAAAEPSDLQKAADAAAAKLEQKPTMFQLSLLDKAATPVFGKIDCPDGSDLLYRWELKSAEEVTNQHIENAEAFRGWYKANCSQAQLAP